LTIGQNGFHYELMSRVLLGGDFEPAPAQTLRSDDEGATLLLASALARGQGKTEGLHERIIVIPPKLRDRLRAPDSRARLAVRALENVQQARKMRSKVLFPALRRIALDDKVPVDRFDARTDEIYFEHLFGFAEHDDEAAKSDWENALRSIASSELQSAINRCSVPSHRWFAVVSHAEGVFRSCLAKQFPSLAASLRKRDTVEDR
jgi:CRISPR system Cascade subunit CasA